MAVEEISTGQERGDEQRQERGWKLFFLSPRKPPMPWRVGPKEKVGSPVREILLRTMEVIDRRQHGRFQFGSRAEKFGP